MSYSNDNAKFDRLADGELTALQRRDLLASLDEASTAEDRAEGWRRCALSLLEAQVLRTELRSFVSEAAPLQDAKISAAPTPARRAGTLRWGRALALAASTLLAFGLGWSMNPNKQPIPTEGATTDRIAATNAMPEPAGLRDAVTLVVHDEQGRQQRVRLPLIDADELGARWAHLRPEVPENLKTGLRNHGFDVRSQQRFAPLFFEQGQQLVPMVVPVSDTYVVPVDRPVY